MNSLPDLSTLPDRLLALLGPDASHPLMFSSGLFWALFVAFLPVYAWLRNSGRIAAMKIFVSAFSLYFFFHNSGWLFLLLVFTAAIDWGVSHRIASASSVGRRRAWLLFSLILSLGVLVAFKYTNFFIDNLRMLTGNAAFRPLSLTLPLGLSFYTFRTISYVVDVFRRRIDPARSFLDYLFFLSFFPCLTAGPIVRADHFMPQLSPDALRQPVDRARIYGGFFTVLMGVIKKAVIADYLAQYSNIAFGNPAGYSGVELLMGALGYGLQIYCDFSGYSDMAIGLGAILGFDLGINFDFPYRSRNVTEFWRRWHISLSLWLRDYLYIPLGGNRRGAVRQYVNLLVTMLLGGLWHGAAWTFIAWGAGHGVALCLHKRCKVWLDRLPDGGLVGFLSWALTFAWVIFLFIFFRADSFDTAREMIVGIATRFDPAYFPEFAKVRYVWTALFLSVFALHFVPTPFYDRLRDLFVRSPWIVKFVLFVAVVQLVISFASADVQPFIYTQF